MPPSDRPAAAATAGRLGIETQQPAFDTIFHNNPQLRIVGIDPGLSGAVAIIQGDSLVVFDMPTHAVRRGRTDKRDLDLTELARLIDAAAPISHAFVEQVAAMPGQGVSSMFAFGKSYGAVLGIIAASFIPTTLVPPGTWKRALGVPAGKDGARARASALMPQHAGLWVRAKDHGRAESALIALYGARVAS